MKPLALTLLLGLTQQVCAEPGIAVIYQPRQATSAGQAKAHLRNLIDQNGLVDHQFSLKSVDLSTSAGRQFQRTYELTEADLPALAYYQREGNRIMLRSLVRRYQSPLKAAETAFHYAQLEEPRLIQSATLFTGINLTSNPPGARVLLREKELGVTPCRVALPIGHSALTLVHPDFLSQSLPLQLKAGQMARQDVSLTPAPSQVLIESAGVPLEVSLDGRPLGSTPVTVETTAGMRRLSVGAGGHKPLNIEFRARAQARTQVLLRPVADRVRVGLGEVTADGYLIGRDFDILPWSTGGVELSAPDFAKRLRNNLETSKVQLVSNAPDCSLDLDVDAWERFVKAKVIIRDSSGKPLHTLVAERDMPVVTFDEESAARQRGADLVDELSQAATQWILQNVKSGPASQEEQQAQIREL